MILQRYNFIEFAAQPLISVTSPVNRMPCVDGFPPAPTGFAPKRFPFIASVIDECSKLCICDGGPRDREWLDLDFVDVHLVVENERPVRHTANQEPAAWYLGI